MLFPTHLVAGYLVGERSDLPVPWAVAGAALPDLVDKTLATVGVTDRYQTVAHSLPALLVAVAALPASDRSRAVRLGWASHLPLDAAHMALNGRRGDLPFLLWPLVDHEPSVNLPPLEWAATYVGSPSFFAESAVWLAAGYAYLRDDPADDRTG